MTLTALPEQSTHPADDTTETPSDSVVSELTADQVAQHPDNIRDAGRGIRELTASISEVGVLVPLIVVPVQAVPRPRLRPGVTHSVDGHRGKAAGLPLPCIVRSSAVFGLEPPSHPLKEH